MHTARDAVRRGETPRREVPGKFAPAPRRCARGTDGVRGCNAVRWRGARSQRDRPFLFFLYFFFFLVIFFPGEESTKKTETDGDGDPRTSRKTVDKDRDRKLLLTNPRRTVSRILRVFGRPPPPTGDPNLAITTRRPPPSRVFHYSRIKRSVKK